MEVFIIGTAHRDEGNVYEPWTSVARVNLGLLTHPYIISISPV